MQEKDLLLRKLLEAELDGTAAAKQVSALRDTVSHMSHSTSVCGVCHTLSFFLTKAEVFTLRLRDKKQDYRKTSVFKKSIDLIINVKICLI